MQSCLSLIFHFILRYSKKRTTFIIILHFCSVITCTCFKLNAETRYVFNFLRSCQNSKGCLLNIFIGHALTWQGKPDNRFGSSETKLLYTLHWIILDAASECEDADAEFMALRDIKGSSLHLHSLSTIQLFVYLFAPLVHLMKVNSFNFVLN